MTRVNYYEKYGLSHAKTYEAIKKENIPLNKIQDMLRQRYENEEYNNAAEGHDERLSDLKAALDVFATEASRAEYDKLIFPSTAKFLVDRGWMDLENEDWEKGEERFEEAIDFDPQYAPAYIGKLCVKLRIKREGELAQYDQILINRQSEPTKRPSLLDGLAQYPHTQKAEESEAIRYEASLIGYKAFQLAVEYASDEYRSQLIQYCQMAETIPTRTQGAYHAKFLVDRGWMDLEDEYWGDGDDYFERALDIDSRYAPAYIGKLCVNLRIRKESELSLHTEKELTDYKAFENAIEVATGEYKNTLEQYVEKAKTYREELEVRRKELIYEQIRKYNSKLKNARQTVFIFFIVVQLSLLSFLIFAEILNVRQSRGSVGFILLVMGSICTLRTLFHYFGIKNKYREWMAGLLLILNISTVIIVWNLWVELVSHFETRRVWRGFWRGYAYVTERIYNVDGLGRLTRGFAIIATIFIVFEAIALCFEFMPNPADKIANIEAEEKSST